MLTKGIVALAVCLSEISACFAYDANEALEKCRTSCQKLQNDIYVIMEGNKGIWNISDLTIWPVRSVDYGQIDDLKALKGLTCYNDEGFPPKRIERLAELQQLRRLELTYVLTKADLDALSRLENLEQLSIHYNDDKHGGKGIESLGNLKNLRSLTIADVDIDDSIIECLKPLKHLDKLDVRDGIISDAILKELKLLANLREIDLQSNKRITDVGLDELKQFRNLQFLSLDSINPIGVTSIKDLASLNHLSIGTYKPERGKGDLSEIEKLNWLEIGSIEGDLISSVHLPEKLERLELSRKAAAKLDFRSSPHIKFLHIDLGKQKHNQQSSNLNWIKLLPELRELELGEPNDTEVISISKQTSVTALKISGACLGTIGDEGMNAIGGMRQLESLELDTSGVTDEGMSVLSNLTELHKLKLTLIPSVTSLGLKNIYKLNKLQSLTLDLSGESLKTSVNSVLEGIGSLEALEELTLHGDITDDGLKKLESLKKLRILDLSPPSGYTDAGLASLMNSLPNLQVVKIIINAVPKKEEK